MRKEQVLVLVGTKKGLFFCTSSAERTRWSISDPHWQGKEINHAVYDPRNGIVLATVNDPWFGCQIARTASLGKSWETSKENPKFDPDSGLKLERIWHIEPGLGQFPSVLFAGVAPAALFRSEDAGQNWLEIKTLTQHPTRPMWQPGGGGMCLHSINVDPYHSDRMFVAVSAAGTFRTEDGGKSWRPINRGKRADFLPEKYPEIGQCIHKSAVTRKQPGLIYEQTHCGVYRSEDGGDSWKEISAGLPSDFGFPLVLHPKDPATVYVVPLQGADFRVPPDHKLRVYRSRNGGNSWEPLTQGLPQRKAFVGIYREGFAADELDPVGLYLGTNTGRLFYSRNEGESWKVLADNFPPVYSVSVALINQG